MQEFEEEDKKYRGVWKDKSYRELMAHYETTQGNMGEYIHRGRVSVKSKRRNDLG